MDALLKLVRTYRHASGLAERLRLADAIFREIEPKLRFFVLGSLKRPAAEDVHQEALKAIAIGLGQFTGNTPGEFWSWCYRIARNKVGDQIRRQAADRLQPMDTEELWHWVESSAQETPISAADRIDLEHAMQLLGQSKPECRDYLTKHFILGLGYSDIAEEQDASYDTIRMRIGRCLDEAQSLMT